VRFLVDLIVGGRFRKPAAARFQLLPARFATRGTTAATTTAAGTATAATAAKAAATAAAALGLGTRLIDVERTTVEFVTVEGRDRAIGFRRIRHFDEGEATRTAGVAVCYQVDTVHTAVGLEEATDGRFSCCEIQIAYKDVFHIVICL
jgi:hypothetical protein